MVKETPSDKDLGAKVRYYINWLRPKKNHE